MNILMTGASGFIGGHLKNQIMAEQKISLVCLSRLLSDPKTDKVFDLVSGNYDSLPSSRCIIHCAQTRNYKSFSTNANDVFKVNVESTFNLLEHAIKNGTEHFILISSGSVYENRTDDLLETSLLSPTSPNGITKHMAEQVASLYSDRLKICILRIFFPFGPGQTAQLVPQLIDAIKKKRTIELCDQNGLNFPPTFVKDISRLVVKAYTEGWVGTFNVSAPNTISLRNFCDLIGDQLNVRAVYKNINLGSQTISPSRKKLTEICPDFNWTSLEAGIKKTLAALNRA